MDVLIFFSITMDDLTDNIRGWSYSWIHFS